MLCLSHYSQASHEMEDTNLFDYSLRLTDLETMSLLLSLTTVVPNYCIIVQCDKWSCSHFHCLIEENNTVDCDIPLLYIYQPPLFYTVSGTSTSLIFFIMHSPLTLDPYASCYWWSLPPSWYFLLAIFFVPDFSSLIVSCLELEDHKPWRSQCE